MPMFGEGVSNTALQGAARELAAGLRYARSEAVAQAPETFVAIDLAGRRFKVAGSASSTRCRRSAS